MDNERTSGSAPVPQEDAGRIEGQLELFRETIRLEDRRLDEHRRRAELAKQALELSDEQDKRQVEYAARELESRERADIRHHRLVARLLYMSGGFFVLAVGLVLFLVFFGTSKQASTALDILGYLGTGIGGAGAIYMFRSTVRWMVNR